MSHHTIQVLTLIFVSIAALGGIVNIIRLWRDR